MARGASFDARTFCAFFAPRAFQSGQGRAELAGGEGVEGAEAGGEFGSGEAALAVEAAEKIGGGGFPFLRVAFHATGDQVAVGIAPRARLRHDVVQALDRRRGAAQAIEALVALARVVTEKREVW
jgi:hypothetical protein